MSQRDFADFYTSAFPQVSRAVRAFCGDADVAREATQEAFARCYARWRRLNKEPWVEGWVTTTAVNITRGHFRRQARPQLVTMESNSPGPTADRLDLLAALRALPERQREAVVLHHLLDLPIRGVAESMRLSEGAVKSHLHKGRAALRQLMGVGHG